MMAMTVPKCYTEIHMVVYFSYRFRVYVAIAQYICDAVKRGVPVWDFKISRSIQDVPQLTQWLGF